MEMRPAMAAGLVTIGLAASAGLQRDSDKAEIDDLLRQMRATAPAASTAAATAPGAAPAGGPAGGEAGASGPPASLAAQGGRVQILTHGPLRFEWNGGSLTAAIHLWNRGARTERVSFSAAVHDPKAEPRKAAIALPAAPVVVNPRGIVRRN